MKSLYIIPSHKGKYLNIADAADRFRKVEDSNPNVVEDLPEIIPMKLSAKSESGVIIVLLLDLLCFRSLFFFMAHTGHGNGDYKNDDANDTELAELGTLDKPDNRKFSEGQESLSP